MDERLNDIAQEDAAPAPVVPKKKKKKKKMGKLTFFFWLILLALGTATGLHLSGIWDGRPLFWNVVPQIPYVGKQLAEFFRIPEIYSLTVNERRAIELKDWQQRLDALERALANSESAQGVSFDEQMNALNTLSRDLGRRQRVIEQQEALLSSDNDSSSASAAEQELMNQVARTYQDMSARNAAAIVEQLRDALAVELLMKLPNDARASIMGKIKPAKAARITELMTRARR